MSSVIASVVKNTENTFKVAASINGVLQNHSFITSAELRTDKGVTIASSSAPQAWSFANSDYLTVKLGLANIPVGSHKCHLILKTNQFPIGISWETDVFINVLP